MSNKRIVTAEEVMFQALQCAMNIEARFGQSDNLPHLKLYGVPRGGVSAALAVLSKSNWQGWSLTSDLDQANAVVDDIYDSGATAKRFKAFNTRFFTLFDKREPLWAGQWLVMPWEGSEEGSAEDIVTRLLQYIGEDPNREGLKDTPARVLRAWKERTIGYGQDPAAVLKSFEDGAQGCDELVIVHNIPVISACEHHLADIVGVAHVGYIPNGRIVGLSKLARLVEIYTRRLIVQERATVQIADALVKHLEPLGVGVLIRASHACMSTRGVKVHGSVTTTSAMRGALMDRGEARKEFMDLCAMAERDAQ